MHLCVGCSNEEAAARINPNWGKKCDYQSLHGDIVAASRSNSHAHHLYHRSQTYTHACTHNLTETDTSKRGIDDAFEICIRIRE